MLLCRTREPTETVWRTNTIMFFVADKHDHVSKCMHVHRNNMEQGARSLALFVSVHLRHVVSEKAAGCTSIRLNVSAPTKQL